MVAAVLTAVQPNRLRTDVDYAVIGGIDSHGAHVAREDLLPVQPAILGPRQAGFADPDEEPLRALASRREKSTKWPWNSWQTWAKPSPLRASRRVHPRSRAKPDRFAHYILL